MADKFQFGEIKARYCTSAGNVVATEKPSVWDALSLKKENIEAKAEEAEGKQPIPTEEVAPIE